MLPGKLPSSAPIWMSMLYIQCFKLFYSVSHYSGCPRRYSVSHYSTVFPIILYSVSNYSTVFPIILEVLDDTAFLIILQYFSLFWRSACLSRSERGLVTYQAARKTYQATSNHVRICSDLTFSKIIDNFWIPKNCNYHFKKSKISIIEWLKRDRGKTKLSV